MSGTESYQECERESGYVELPPALLVFLESKSYSRLAMTWSVVFSIYFITHIMGYSAILLLCRLIQGLLLALLTAKLLGHSIHYSEASLREHTRRLLRKVETVIVKQLGSERACSVARGENMTDWFSAFFTVTGIGFLAVWFATPTVLFLASSFALVYEEKRDLLQPFVTQIRTWTHDTIGRATKVLPSAHKMKKKMH